MMTPAGSFFPHPEGMSEDAAELWRHIVDAHPRGYFQAGDVPLLRAYCEEYARRNRWHEVLVNSNSSLSQLATKLRLCVNSRINAKAAGKHDEKPKPKRAGLMFGA